VKVNLVFGPNGRGELGAGQFALPLAATDVLHDEGTVRVGRGVVAALKVAQAAIADFEGRGDVAFHGDSHAQFVIGGAGDRQPRGDFGADFLLDDRNRALFCLLRRAGFRGRVLRVTEARGELAYDAGDENCCQGI
jgi:hypothetical protein